MLANFLKGRAALLATLSMFFCANVHAQATIPYQEVHTASDTQHAVPVEHSFQVGDTTTYQVTLVDLGAAFLPSAPLASLQLAVTQGSAVVGTLSAAGNLQFNGTGGSTYTIHVVGALGAVPGSGPIGIQVTELSGNKVVESYSDTLALPPTAPPTNENWLDDSFSVGTTGSYVVTLTDLKLPQALTTLTANIILSDGTLVTNPPLTAAGSATVSLQQGVTYRIFAIGQADPTVDAGLFSVVVTPSGGGAPVYGKAIQVGTVAPAQNAALTAGSSYTLSLADLGVPTALTNLSGVVTLNGQAITQLNAAGTSPPFTASGATYQVFVSASTPTEGSYALAVVSPSGPAALSDARAVSAPGSGVSAYSYDTTVTSPGSYNFDLVDFSKPTAPLMSLSGMAVQAGAVLGSPLKAAGTAGVTTATGPISLLVFAQPVASGGLIDVDLTPSVGGAALFETTQGVGKVFVGRQLSITTAGSYAVNVSDLGFPSSLGTFAVIATYGSTQIGSIYGGGAFAFTAATPGNYFINFIAEAGAAGAGTYSLSVTPAPVVNLNVSTQSVASGGTVSLTWSSQNTASCVASGGWSGTQPTTGAATSAPLTAATTFTLTCTGSGVNLAKSVTVDITPPPPNNNKGGGGVLSQWLLLALAAVLGVKFWFRRERALLRR
jgi:hypothetical protein